MILKNTLVSQFTIPHIEILWRMASVGSWTLSWSPRAAVSDISNVINAVSYLPPDVRFGSQADIWAGVMDVRFTPESRHGAYCTG